MKPAALATGAVRRRLLILSALVVVLIYHWQASSPPVARFNPMPPARAAAADAFDDVAQENSFESLLRTDPVGALVDAREAHLRNVRDYTCTFVKQESLPKGMSAEQVISVKFREAPFTVMMHWVRNEDMAKRVIYQAGRWIDSRARPDEREQAVCQPGVIAQLFLKSIKQPTRGARARQTSRRFIDEFGFIKALDIFLESSKLAQSRNELTMEFLGESQFDGRPTWVIRRFLPYTGPDCPYPDGTVLLHLDQEWRVFTAIYSYADRESKQLLGRYEYRSVKMNPGLAQSEFEPATYGM